MTWFSVNTAVVCEGFAQTDAVDRALSGPEPWHAGA